MLFNAPASSALTNVHSELSHFPLIKQANLLKLQYSNYFISLNWDLDVQVSYGI